MDFIFDSRLVLYLPLYQLDGASFMSKDAYGHLCTKTGALWRLEGHYFDGDDSISAGNAPSIASTVSDFTVLAWVKGAGNQAAYTAMAIAHNDFSAALRSWLLGFQLNDYKIRVSLSANGVNNAKDYYSSMNVLDNSWHQVGFTFKDGVLTLYNNGVADPNPTKTVDNAITACQLTTSNVQVGSCLNTGVPSNWFVGSIPEGLIYTPALPAQGVMRNYLATKWRYQ